MALHPLVPVAALFAGGVALGRMADPAAGLCLLLLAGTLLSWWLLEWRWPGMAPMGLCVAVVAAGATVYQGSQRYGPATHIARFLPSPQPRLITCRLTTLTAPDNAVVPTADTTAFQQFVGRVDAVESTRGWIPAAGNVLVRVPHGVAIAPGQRLELLALGAAPAPPANPGEFDGAAYLRGAGIFTVLQVKLPGQVRALTAGGITPQGLVQWFRLHLRAQLLGYAGRADAAAGHTMVALLLGHRDSSISDIGRAFAAGGAAHLLAISGFHIVLISGVLWAVLRWIIPRPRLRSCVVALLVGLYILATPCGPPVLRAGLAVGLVLIAAVLCRAPVALNLLAGALLVVLAGRPADIFDAGLQLSFVVTAGLITLVPRVHRVVLAGFLERRAALARARGTTGARLKYQVLRLGSTAVVVNAVGTLLSMPLVAFHFNQINPLAVLLGVLVVPVVMVGILLTLVELLAALAGTWAAALTTTLTVRWTLGLVWLMKHLAALPLAVIVVPAPPWYLVVLLYAGVVLWLVRPALHLSRATMILALSLPLPLLAAFFGTSAARPALDMWHLAVPHGACLVVRTAGDRVFLVNAGAGSAQFTARVLEPFLRRTGIGHIDMVLCTSLDQAHAGALGDLAAVWHPRHVLGPAWDPARFAAADLLPRDLPLELLSAGGRIALGKQILGSVLWPPPEPRPDLPYVQKSLILRLTTGPTGSILIAGPRQSTPLTPFLAGPPPATLLFLPGSGGPDLPLWQTLAAAHAPELLIHDGPDVEPDELSLPEEELPDSPAPASPIRQCSSAHGCVHIVWSADGHWAVAPAGH